MRKTHDIDSIELEPEIGAILTEDLRDATEGECPKILDRTYDIAESFSGGPSDEWYFRDGKARKNITDRFV